MPYKLIKPLPSCNVERKLLIELESYIKHAVMGFASTNEQKNHLKYIFIIMDSCSSDTFNSINDYERQYLPNDIKNIRMKCEGGHERNLTIEINFNVDRMFTGVQIWCNGNFAREMAHGIYAGIVSFLESYRTLNKWFHIGQGLAWILLMGILAILIVLLGFALNLLLIWKISFFVLAILFALATFLFVPAFKPYSTFETKRNEVRKKQFNWLVLGFIAYIFFTVIGVYFRQKVFGF